jgi:PKD repeat protein
LPNSTVASPSVIYSASGSYNVSLTVVNANGCSSTVTRPVVVQAVPVAGFTATTVCSGSPTVFTNTSTGASVNGWLFGSGSATSLQANPTFTYPAAGTYTVRLITTNPLGCTDTATSSVVVTIDTEVAAVLPWLALSRTRFCARPTVKVPALGLLGLYSTVYRLVEICCAICLVHPPLDAPVKVRSDAENPVTASLNVTVTVKAWVVNELLGALKITDGRASRVVVKEAAGVDCVVPIEFVADNL